MEQSTTGATSTTDQSTAKKPVIRTIVVSLKEIQFANDGRMVAVCAPNEVNAKGSYVFNEAQENRILGRLGVNNAEALKHIVAVCNNTCKLKFQAEDCKAGEAFTKSDGTTDTYTKDWTKFSNHEIELGTMGKTMLAAEAVRQSIGGRRGVRPVAAPVVENSEPIPAPIV